MHLLQRLRLPPTMFERQSLHNQKQLQAPVLGETSSSQSQGNGTTKGKTEQSSGSLPCVTLLGFLPLGSTSQLIVASNVKGSQARVCLAEGDYISLV